MFVTDGVRQSGGIVESNASGFSLGLFIKSGDYFMSGGRLDASTFVPEGSGVLLSGHFIMTDGTLNATGEGIASKGMSIDDGGDFVLKNGVVNASGEKGGIGLRTDKFVMDQGRLTAFGESQNGIGVNVISGLEIHGGTLDITGENTGIGMACNRSDFVLKDGVIQAQAYGFDPNASFGQCSTGIRVGNVFGFMSLHFRQDGGDIIAYGENGGDGIRVENGNYVMNGGTLGALGEGSTIVSEPGSNRIVVTGGSIVKDNRSTVYYGCGIGDKYTEHWVDLVYRGTW